MASSATSVSVFFSACAAFLALARAIAAATASFFLAGALLVSAGDSDSADFLALARARAAAIKSSPPFLSLSCALRFSAASLCFACLSIFACANRASRFSWRIRATSAFLASFSAVLISALAIR